MPEPTRLPPNPPENRDEALRRVRAHGGRLTPAKRALIDLLHAGGSAFTAEEIVERLPGHDRSVVYRNLGQLQEIGVAEHLHLGHGPAVYRATGSSTALVVCDGCGSVEEVDRDEFDGFADRIRDLTGIRPDFTHFPLTGTCRSCSRRP